MLEVLCSVLRLPGRVLSGASGPPEPAPPTRPLEKAEKSGKTSPETVAFALDGTSYEIELPAEEATELRRRIGVYASAARRATRA